jgi:hypothetical protein
MADQCADPDANNRAHSRAHSDRFTARDVNVASAISGVDCGANSSSHACPGSGSNQQAGDSRFRLVRKLYAFISARESTDWKQVSLSSMTAVTRQVILWLSVLTCTRVWKEELEPIANWPEVLPLMPQHAEPAIR